MEYAQISILEKLCFATCHCSGFKTAIFLWLVMALGFAAKVAMFGFLIASKLFQFPCRVCNDLRCNFMSLCIKTVVWMQHRCVIYRYRSSRRQGFRDVCAGIVARKSHIWVQHGTEFGRSNSSWALNLNQSFFQHFKRDISLWYCLMTAVKSLYAG